MILLKIRVSWSCWRRNWNFNFYKFPGDKIPIVKGSALNAVEGKDEATGKNAIMELMKADDTIPQPNRLKTNLS